MRIRSKTFIVALFALVETACGGSGSPSALAEKLTAAITQGDRDAAFALLSTPNASADIQFSLLVLLQDCAYGHQCMVSPGPVTDEVKKDMAKARDKDGHVPSFAPEGLLSIEDTIKTKDGGSSMKFQLPYAKVDGQYRIVTDAYTPEKLRELQAKSPQTITDEMLANGIGGDPAWKSKAEKLASDGGDAGKALAEYVTASSKAFKTKDFDTLIVLGGDRGKILYRLKENDGTPVPEKKRELVLAVQSVQELADIHVLGGYVMGNDAAVIFEGHDGAGWIARGAYLMELKGGKWTPRIPLVERLPPTS